MDKKKFNQIWVFPGIISWVMILLAILLVFFYAPKEKTMGHVQKIFYFHVPSAWIAFLAFFVVFIGSVRVLIKKDIMWDVLAVSAAEIGFIFTTIVLITGPLWAKPVWYIWWTWDIRLTSTLILWLIYAGYFLLREMIPDSYNKARLSAVIGILAFIDIPIVYFSIRLWRTQHPSPVFAGGKGSGLDPQMKFVFFFCLIAFSLFFVYLLRMNYTVKAQKRNIDEMNYLIEELEHEQ